jgi:hypothetical protein
MMKHRWLNDGEADENGDFIAVIENAAGGRISTFKGKSYKDVADQLLNSQISANIAVQKSRRPDTAPPKFNSEVKTLSPSDRMRLTNEISDPATVVEAVEEILTASQGAPPAAVGQQLSKQAQDALDKFYADEAQAFRIEYPNFYPVPQNRDALFDYLEARSWDLTRNNLAIAYETLADQMIPWPEGAREAEQDYLRQQRGNGSESPRPANGETTPIQSGPAPRPRTVSTGIRNSDASASAPIPVRNKKYTRADIERMSRADFSRKISEEPGFKQQVDAMGS